MASEYSGRFLYSLQGIMHGRNITPEPRTGDKLDEPGEFGKYEQPGVFEVGLADPSLHKVLTPRDKPLLDAFTTYYPEATPNTPYYQSDADLPRFGAYDELQFADTLVDADSVDKADTEEVSEVRTMSRVYRSRTGFYPFSEMGIVVLTDEGTAHASMRLNMAGDFKNEFRELKGRWGLDQPDGAVKNPGKLWSKPENPMVRPGDFRIPLDLDPSLLGPTGVISLLQLPDPNDKKKFVWDYVFGFISKDEATLMAGGRHVRPAVASGRMWRLSPNPN